MPNIKVKDVFGHDVVLHNVSAITALNESGTDLETYSSGGGTGDYLELENKPKINNVELIENKSLHDLSIQHELTAGSNIEIANNVISATIPVTDWTDISDKPFNTIGSGLKVVDNELETDLEIPTKTSDLTNDSNFQNAIQVQALVNALDNELANVAKSGDYNDLINTPTDLGKVDDVKVNGTSVVTNKVAEVIVPTATSDLTNDSDFQTSSEVEAAIVVKNYTTMSEVEAKNYTTMAAVEAKGYALESEIPTLTSDLTNDSGFITTAALSGYATEIYVNNHHDSTKEDVIDDLAEIRAGAVLGATALQEVPEEYVTETELQNYHDSTKANVADLAAVATTGDYEDLINKPDIPSGPMIFKGTLGEGGTIISLPPARSTNKGHSYKVITAGTYAGQDAKVGDLFTSDGEQWVLIPSGDEPAGTVTNIATGTGLAGGPITSSGTISLSSDTIASLAKADTALQEHQDISGKADITYVDSEIDIVEDEIALKQDILTAGQNITIIDNVISAADAPTPPVLSVNGQTGNVVLDAEDVSALPDDTPLFSGDYNDLTNKPTIPVVPTNVSAFTNDAGYLTQHQDITGKADITYVDSEIERVEDEIPSIEGLATETYVNTGLATKQNTLTAGANITIVNDVISASGGGGGTSLTEDDYLTEAEIEEMFDEDLIWDGTIE